MMAFTIIKNNGQGMGLGLGRDDGFFFHVVSEVLVSFCPEYTEFEVDVQ